MLIAAADTFRAAAYDQLSVWANRANVDFTGNPEGRDPAAVAFDAVKSAKKRGHDFLLVDTAGRMHTRSNLMTELGKIEKVADKALPGAPYEVWLVIDATTGQNAIMQTENFMESVGVTGLILTKLDGTAKGGIALAIHHKFSIPIRYIGVGERLEDLVEFNAEQFVDEMLTS